MAREYATIADVLGEMRKRLIDRTPGLSEADTLFAAASPVPASTPHGDLFATISVQASTFNREHFAGGGWHTLTESYPIDIAIFSRVTTDAPDDGETMLLSPDRGLFSVFLPRILAAFTKDGEDDWELEFDSNKLLRDYLQPTSTAIAGASLGNDDWTALTVSFEANFDWGLLG